MAVSISNTDLAGAPFFIAQIDRLITALMAMKYKTPQQQFFAYTNGTYTQKIFAQ